MLKRWIRKYFSIVFILATLVGVMHHHDDAQTHSDCQICVIQSNIVDGDVPVYSPYLSDIQIFSEAVITELHTLYIRKNLEKLHSRAPPKIS